MTPERESSRSRVTSKQRGSIGFLFFLFAAALIYAVLFLAMPISQARIEDRQHRDLFLLAVAALGIGAGVTARRPGTRTREERIIAASAIALPCYALFQIVPLPMAVVGALSPVRAELVRALAPVSGLHRFASLSIVPAATFTHSLLQISYCVIFFAAWEVAARAREKVWAIAGPIVLAAAVEAILGLLQFFSGQNNVAVSGTYTVRNHFAGLLEMAVPFPAIYAFAALRKAIRRGYIDGRTAGRAAAGAALTALLIAGVLFSLSRGGLAAMLASALLMAVAGTSWNMSPRRKVATAFAFALFTVVALFSLTPMSMVARLSQHSTAGRLSVWREGVAIIAQYPLVGCGLGGFESAFLRFKTVERVLIVDYAHNDYLQLLAELGAAGFLTGAVLLGSVAKRVAEIARDTSSDTRWAALACVGSLAAIAVHSAVDFNLYVAGNAAVLAWICGLATGVQRVRRLPRTRTGVESDSTPEAAQVTEPGSA